MTPREYRVLINAHISRLGLSDYLVLETFEVLRLAGSLHAYRCSWGDGTDFGRDFTHAPSGPELLAQPGRDAWDLIYAWMYEVEEEDGELANEVRSALSRAMGSLLDSAL